MSKKRKGKCGGRFDLRFWYPGKQCPHCKATTLPVVHESDSRRHNVSCSTCWKFIKFVGREDAIEWAMQGLTRSKPIPKPLKPNVEYKRSPARLPKKVLESGAAPRRPEIKLKPVVNVTPKSRWQRSDERDAESKANECDSTNSQAGSS